MSQHRLNFVLAGRRVLLVLLLIGVQVSASCILEDLAKEVKGLKQILVKDVGALTKKIDDLNGQNELQQKQLKNISGLLACACSDKPPATVEEACKQAAADIVFALDASGSIGSTNFQKVIDFVQSIVQMLEINGVSGSQVGLLTFDSTTRLQFQLNKYKSKTALLRAIKGTKYTGGETNIGGAISYARAVMFQSTNGDRATVPNYLVIMTDARTSARESTLKEAARARQQGIKIIAVGIGSGVNLKDLEALASPPSKSNAFFAASFSTLVEDVRNSLGMSICEKKKTGQAGKPSKPRDCAEVLASGSKTSGVYTVYVGSTKRPVQVYCDMTTDGGGWLVFQRRKDGSVNFYRNWASYAKGFGSVTGEFWLGNENLHSLTNAGITYRLRVDLEDFTKKTRYAEYSNLRIGSAGQKYKLASIGKYSGTAGDSLAYHLGQRFSTPGHDSSGSCTVRCKGAWWYRSCHYANLNGKYYSDPRKSKHDGLEWYKWTGWNYSLKFTEMKIRPN